MDPKAIDHVRTLYAPPSDPTFELVPATFASMAQEFYVALGSPPVTSDNVWDVYLGIRTQFYQLEGIPDKFQQEWDSNLTMARLESDARDANEAIELLPDLRELAGGKDYMGGVNGGLGLGRCHLFNTNTSVSS